MYLNLKDNLRRGFWNVAMGIGAALGFVAAAAVFIKLLVWLVLTTAR